MNSEVRESQRKKMTRYYYIALKVNGKWAYGKKYFVSHDEAVRNKNKAVAQMQRQGFEIVGKVNTRWRITRANTD